MILLTRERVSRMAHSVTTTRAVLLADDTAVDAIILLAEALHHEQHRTPLVFVESSIGFTQRMRPSTMVVPGMPDGVIATFSILDQQGIPARLCSALDLPGCHDGSVLDLARAWLATLNAPLREDTTLLVSGSVALQEQASLLASELHLHCRVMPLLHPA